MGGSRLLFVWRIGTVAGMSCLLPYLVVPLFFTADYTASEETLAAGVSGYQKRAESARKGAATEAESKAKDAAAKLAAVRRGRIDSALVGTPRSSGVERNGQWTFGTATERAEMVSVLSFSSEAWRRLAADLRAKTVWPQITFFITWDGITPGAVGCFGKKTITELRAIDRDKSSAAIPAAVLREADPPVIRMKPGVFASVVIEHGGNDAQLRGVYQFIGTKDGSAVFKLVESLKVGAVDPD